ncbi:type IV pilus assembly protein PilM [Kingella denitrificans]|uniref:type IV pilus assembly protein PilM n=1 Tax=Kingella denitrificans TaxID=502 RepID=UPI0028D8CCBB|nr:type IV pilus assembly protein PilM [Kingella denitrificans]
MRSRKNGKNTSNKADSSISRNSVIGVDIGQGGIRMVQLSGRKLNQVQLEKYAAVTLPGNVVSGNDIVDFDQLVSHLQQCYTKLKTSCKQVNIALPSGIVTIEENFSYDPEGNDISLQEMVESEVVRVGALDGVNYDWKELSEDPRTGVMSVVIAAAKTDDVNSRVDLLEEVGLQAVNVDVDVFALANAFIYTDEMMGNQFTRSKILVVNVGDVNMNAMVLQNNKILFRHEANLGFEQLVQLIQRTYQCTDSEAVAMAYGRGSRPGDYRELITESFNMQIAQEVQRALQFFLATQNMDEGVDISQIFISGIGCTDAAGLDHVVSTHTNIPTQQCAPVSLAASKSKIDGTQLQKDADSLTMAFGLALRGLV